MYYLSCQGLATFWQPALIAKGATANSRVFMFSYIKAKNGLKIEKCNFNRLTMLWNCYTSEKIQS